MNTGHWQYPCDIDVSKWFGFIYRIIDTENNKQYIGKKQFFSHTTKKVTGRVNKVHTHTEANWQAYTGSSVNLNAEILAKGKDKFIFIIESLHEKKGSLHYAEVDKQVRENVLLAKFENGERKYYNGCISGVKFLPTTPSNTEVNAQINNVLKILYSRDGEMLYNKLTSAEQEVFGNNYNDTVPYTMLDEATISAIKTILTPRDKCVNQSLHDSMEKARLNSNVGLAAETPGLIKAVGVKTKADKAKNKVIKENTGTKKRRVVIINTAPKRETVTEISKRIADERANAKKQKAAKAKAPLVCPCCKNIYAPSMSKFHGKNCKTPTKVG